eukprot:TRINITY_DN2832_c0_g1_i1.p1 TRINITY_DN2832_c0_g1~~TRINITY_DN2832_c0_g1_i1.p1  ORF type:complete len:165 (-),score=16.76 TRINITY_DN2832_c0_g1_i1:243-737(-)
MFLENELLERRKQENLCRSPSSSVEYVTSSPILKGQGNRSPPAFFQGSFSVPNSPSFNSDNSDDSIYTCISEPSVLHSSSGSASTKESSKMATVTDSPEINTVSRPGKVEITNNKENGTWSVEDLFRMNSPPLSGGVTNKQSQPILSSGSRPGTTPNRQKDDRI